jgi:hypothetical protein
VVSSERGKANEEGKGGQIWLRYFVYMHKNGTLKPIEVILRRGVGKEKITEKMNQTRVQYMYIWKCYNKTFFVTVIY